MNLRDLVILVADPSPFLCLLVHGMLRGFGANKVLEVRDSPAVLDTLTGHKIDVLLCDGALPPHGGFAIGLERLTCQVLNLPNVRQAVLYPRDRYKLTP